MIPDREPEFSHVKSEVAFPEKDSISDIWDLERNRTNVQMGELRELCATLGCKLSDEIPLVSGGVQQYLNRLAKFPKLTDNGFLGVTENDLTMSQCVQTQPSRVEPPVNFNSLPVYVKLHIFSFLDAKDLCGLSGVNREWLSLTSDSVLWNNLLEEDMVKWSVIGHMTHPAVYKEVDSDWSNKEIYLQCCPRIRRLMRRENFAFMNISTMLRSFLPKKAPKIAMFGPGLESSTSGIVRKILYEKTNLFDIKQLFPGQFEGVGSGMTLQMKSGLLFDLTVLYSSTRRERENWSGDRMQRNRLIQRNVREMEEGQIEASAYELTQAVRDLCRTLDAFIYVVDAGADSFKENVKHSELFAMVNERWSATHVPVLVLSCVPSACARRLPCVEVVDRLQLTQLDKPWQVHDIEVEKLTGLVDAIQWVIEQSHRR